MPSDLAARRSTEGPRKGAIARGKRTGRPPGAKNKPKGLIPLPLAEDIIKSLQPMLPPEQMRYLRSVVKDGAALDTRKELDTLILLLNRSIWPALAYEAIPYDDPTDRVTKAVTGEGVKTGEEGEDGEPEVTDKRPPTTILRKDVTDRLKVLTSLLNMRAGLDKSQSSKDDEEAQPILKLFAARGIDTRIAVLMGPRDGPKQLLSDTEVTVVEG